ncbi:unnamed protein product [Caenorhabditis brenneri]
MQRFFFKEDLRIIHHFGADASSSPQRERSATPFTEEWRRQLNGGEADGNLLSSGPSREELARFGSSNQSASRSQQPRRSPSKSRSPASPPQSRSPSPFTPEAIETAVRSTATGVPLWRRRKTTGSRFPRVGPVALGLVVTGDFEAGIFMTAHFYNRTSQPWRQNGGVRLGGSGHRERGLYRPPPQRGETAAVTSSVQRKRRSSERPQSGLIGRGHSSPPRPPTPSRREAGKSRGEERPMKKRLI